jgi:YbgC/YbaW family acyl-CoA thioester hydrolase
MSANLPPKNVDTSALHMISLEDLKSSVLISKEKVKFSYIDPYGHMNSARYLELMANHRVEAAEEQLGCYTHDLLHKCNLAFVIAEVKVQYLRSSICGEELEIASWIEAISEKGFSLKVLIISAKSRKIKSIGDIEFRSVRAADGKPAIMPTSLPSRGTTEILTSCPTVGSYKRTLESIDGEL